MKFCLSRVATVLPTILVRRSCDFIEIQDVFYWSLLYEYFILTQSSDVRLQDSQERMLAYERRSNEHTKLIAELTQKVREKRN